MVFAQVQISIFYYSPYEKNIYRSVLQAVKTAKKTKTTIHHIGWFRSDIYVCVLYRINLHFWDYFPLILCLILQIIMVDKS